MRGNKRPCLNWCGKVCVGGSTTVESKNRDYVDRNMPMHFAIRLKTLHYRYSPSFVLRFPCKRDGAKLGIMPSSTWLFDANNRGGEHVFNLLRACAEDHFYQLTICSGGFRMKKKRTIFSM